MAQIDRVLISKPHRVLWCGFTTTTARMQQAGWKISSWQDHMGDAIRLAFRHDEFQQSAITNSVSYWRLSEQLHSQYMRMTEDGDPYLLTFEIVRMAHEVSVRCYDDDDNRPIWKAVDAAPQFMSTSKIVRLEDFAVFAEAPLTRTQELIVDPNDVQELMSRIIDLQKPEQDRLRAKARLRESREGLELEAGPKQTFHAQILSIAA